MLGSDYMNDSSADPEKLKLNQSQQKKLKAIRERRIALEFLVGREDVQIMHDLTNVLKDSKIEVLSKETETKLQNYMSMFKDMTLDEANSIIEQHDQVLSRKLSEADKTDSLNLLVFDMLV